MSEPQWTVDEREPGAWYVLKDGERYGGTGPWPSNADAQSALGYLAWVDQGGSPD